MINRTSPIIINQLMIQHSAFRQVIDNFLYQVSCILQWLDLGRIEDCTNSITQRHAIFKKRHQILEPGRDAFPPLLRFAYAIALANTMRTTWMLAYQIHTIFPAHPVSRIKETIPTTHQFKRIWALRLQLLHLQVPLTGETTCNYL